MIKIDHVSKFYKGDIVALKDVTFEIESGEFLFLVGPSGAGKSTLVRLLIREELPTEGSIIFDDTDITHIGKRLLPFYRQQIGVVFQDFKLIDIKTIKENIEFALEITGTSDDEIEETSISLIELVGLQDRQNLFPPQLSGGEKQRAGIARALANEPKLLIADEPTGNLDPVTAKEIIDILETVNSWGTTVLIATHDKDVVDAMKKRVVRLEGGELAADHIGGYDKNKHEKNTPEKSSSTKEKTYAVADKATPHPMISGELIDKLDLSSGTIQQLKENNIVSIDKLLDMSQETIIKLTGIGEKKAEEIVEALTSYLTQKANG